MTTKLKERIVALSRNEKVEKVFKIYWWIILAFWIVSYFIMELKIIGWILGVIGLLVIFIKYALNAIKKQTDEVIKDNKLIHIILSDIDAVENYIFLIVSILSCIVFSFVELNLITGMLDIVIALVILLKLPRVVSKYFKNKLS